MKDPYAHLDDKEYFYSWVFKVLLHKFPLIERILLSLDLKEEIFQLAQKLGYERKEASRINKKVADLFMHEGNHPIQVELPENDYCELALYKIIQERVKNSEILPENLKFLDQFLQKYDPIVPDYYLELVPNDIKIPEFKKETWVKELTSQIPNNTDWITVYSSTEFVRTYFGDQGVEVEKIYSAFIDSKTLDEKIIRNLDLDNFVEVPICKTLTEFKKLPTITKVKAYTKPFIIIKQNNWRLHSSNELVRVDQKFLDENNLTWDESGVLDLKHNEEKVIKYQSWAGPFDGDSYTRHRVAKGVRLQMKRSFLSKYLEKKHFYLLTIFEKERLLANPRLHGTKIIDSKKIKELKIYDYESDLKDNPTATRDTPNEIKSC